MLGHPVEHHHLFAPNLLPSLCLETWLANWDHYSSGLSYLQPTLLQMRVADLLAELLEGRHSDLQGVVSGWQDLWEAERHS